MLWGSSSYLILFSLLFLSSTSISEAKERVSSDDGKWVTISQLAQKHADWLTKDEQLSDFVQKDLYRVNRKYASIFINKNLAAICKLNLYADQKKLQQDVCSFQYTCGKPLNLCYEEDEALENLILGDIYVYVTKTGLLQMN